MHTHTHTHTHTHIYFLNNLHVYNNKGVMLNKVAYSVDDVVQ